MCGITGYFNTTEATSKVQRSLQIMQDRGREAAGIYDGVCTIAKTPAELPYSGSTFALGHVLHPMVGCVPQPLVGRGVLVANCEIYNWKELAKQHNIEARNDTDVLLALLDRAYPAIKEMCELLDGVYAFAYLRENKVILCRDILGIKPLYYSLKEGFSFASEKKAITSARELYPRTILYYNIDNQTISEEQKEFFTISKNVKESYEIQKEKVKQLLTAAVNKRIPETKFGVLLSGGVDSGVLAMILQHANPQCYVVGEESSEDVIAAKELARIKNLPLTILSPTQEEIEKELPAIVQTVEDANPVKISVATTFWFACKQAQIDGCKALFSGGGSEELFAGYERYRVSNDPNNEGLSGLRKLHERDLYRDDTITMYHNIELRLPFLDKELVKYCLNVPAEFKLAEGVDKKILREIAEEIGLPKENAWRKKRAAQYGSKIMKHLEKIGRKHETLATFLCSLLGHKNKKLASLLSTGKDSLLALHTMQRMEYDVVCCITMQSENPDSYMFHTPNTNLAALQAEAMNIPLIVAHTAGEKEEELKQLSQVLAQAKDEYAIEGVITGALQSQYQRDRIEKICDELGLTVFSPLWQMDAVRELELLLAHNYKVVIVKVAAEGLTAEWLGKELTRDMVNDLILLQKKVGVHPAGEGGEYESLVLDAPLFRKTIVLQQTESIKEGNVAELRIKQAKLVEKENAN